ncbi:MAG: hypothetical protein M1296_03750 [Chloroflexi bacterium]|nr:hypothetical protein [Chloroflexota bacterium]
MEGGTYHRRFQHQLVRLQERAWLICAPLQPIPRQHCWGSRSAQLTVFGITA